MSLATTPPAPFSAAADVARLLLLVEGETRPLQPGMCFSIEPGVSLAGRFGVRIEGIVVVDDDGHGRRLNRTDRRLQLVS